MALATQGSVIKPKYTNSFLDKLQPKTSLSTPSPAPSPVQSTQQIKVPTASGVNQTIQQDAQGNKYAPPKSNPSVLEQQKALNKLGAGLIEDGIAGDKTRAAIAQYGSKLYGAGTTSGMIKPKEEAKDSKGLLINPVDAKFDRNTGQPTSGMVPSSTQQPTPPVTPPIDTKSNAERVIGSGDVTDWEKQARNTPEVQKALQDLEELQTKYAGNTTNIAGTAGFLTQQSGLQGLQNQQYSTLLSAAQGRLSNALASQGQQLSAAQTQAQRAQSGAGTVFSSSLNQPSEYGKPTFNPITGQFSSSGQFGGVDASSNIQSIKDYTTQINDIDSQSNAVDTNFSRAINYATTAGLPDNSAILSGIKSKFGGTVQGDTAIAGFNQVIGQLNQQATALGFDPVNPESVTPAQLKQLQEAVKKGLATKKANLQSTKDKLMNPSGSSTGGNMFGSFF